ncbi:hypothetical protein AVEN_151039-1 [Araneus ventricosus]|uniref:Uncharacterized protein n=1 Tax=Araneus ventricosus TaxID=182803 RepID=A0A4Y2IAP3_ARAVE|nr:hypothetical protein AVEN_151039-1 [Araneus ventricosus]
MYEKQPDKLAISRISGWHSNDVGSSYPTPMTKRTSFGKGPPVVCDGLYDSELRNPSCCSERSLLDPGRIFTTFTCTQDVEIFEPLHWLALPKSLVT